MKIYEIIEKIDVWAGDPQSHGADINEIAENYLAEINGYTIKEMRDYRLTEDLETILEERARLNDPIFGLNADTGETTDPVISDQARAKIKLLGRLFKAIAGNLHGYEFCKTRVIDSWRGQYGVKLDFLPTDRNDAGEPKETDVYNLGVEKAEALFDELAGQKILLPGSKEAFIWYFGEPEKRTDKRPTPIYWNGYNNAFAYFCLLVTYENNRIPSDISWKYFANIFTSKNGREWNTGKGGLPNDASSVRTGGECPKSIKINTLKKGLAVLEKERGKPI